MTPLNPALLCLLQEIKHLPVAQVVVVVTGIPIGNNPDPHDDKIRKRTPVLLSHLTFVFARPISHGTTFCGLPCDYALLVFYKWLDSGLWTRDSGLELYLLGSAPCALFLFVCC